MTIFTAPEPPKLPPLIETVIEKPTEEETKPPVTWRDNLEEKIKTNYYGCDTDVEWIRADNAQCLPKSATGIKKTLTAPVNGSGYYIRASSSYYDSGYCTWGAQQLAPWVGEWSHAKYWDDYARRDGLTVSGEPIVGSVFVDNKGAYGHVGLVVGVDGDTITVKDMNYSGLYQWTTRTVPRYNYVYIYPPS